MPLDAICLRAVTRELESTAAGRTIDKVQQPSRDTVLLSLRGGERLLLSAAPGRARCHLTGLTRENPAAPPMFCMLLRKHLQGGRIAGFRQPPLERVLFIDIDARDELGETGRRTLALECLGPRSNLLLLNGEGRILDCLKRVEAETGRTALPGLYYRLPPAQEKRDPLSIGAEEFRALLHAAPDGTDAGKLLLDRFTALSPAVCRELAAMTCADREHLCSPEDRERLAGTFSVWQDTVREGRFTPFLLTEQDGRSVDFSYMPIGQYNAAWTLRPMETFSQLLDSFYGERERSELLRQRGAQLHKAAAGGRDRLRRKLLLQEKEYAETRDRDRLRLYGELITANLYRMTRGESRLTARNYYDPEGAEVDIPLDPLLTPQENAAKYFKRYSKAKTAERCLAEQMEKARRERDWLESVLDELTRAELEQDFEDIRRELCEAGYLKAREKKGVKRPPSRPRVFVSTGGLKILVGRSNTQNDRLTKEAGKYDYWFHTQRVHGAHVILCCQGQPPDRESLTQAATLAAWFSQGRESGQVAVDYTQVKNVKKPHGARPGLVVYDPYETAYVRPDKALVEALERNGGSPL